MASKVVCPSCKFENLAGHSKCLMCKDPLPSVAEATHAVQRGRTTAKTEMFSEGPRAQPTSSISAEGVNIRDVVGWLCCEPLEPIPLLPGAVISIGRSPECDLVLRHRSISRLQGLIRVHNRDNLSFQDEGSANGTFLNGKRTTRATLAPGDVLTFGPYEVHVHSNDSISSRNQELDLEGTQVVEVASMTSGYLSEEGALAELLQGMEFNRKSGTLKILSGNMRGTIVIRDGRPLWASLGADRDEEAIYRMLRLSEARYAFTSTLESAEERMQSTVTALLLEASRRLDQGEQ